MRATKESYKVLFKSCDKKISQGFSLQALYLFLSTVVVNRGEATLKGRVLDAEGQPAAKARVFVRTVNDRQGAVLTAGASALGSPPARAKAGAASPP